MVFLIFYFNLLLKTIFIPTRDEVTGEWSTLSNKELNGIYSTLTMRGNKIDKNELGWAFSPYG